MLEVPAASKEVKVHSPQDFGGGGRSTTGKLVLKPLEYTPAKLDPVTATIVAAATLVVLAAAWLGGRMHLFENMIVSAIGLLLISPPLAAGAYTFLRNDELEPYRGRSLYIRAALCALAYVVLWGIFALLGARGVITNDLWVWIFAAPPFLVAGGLIAVAALDLDFGNGLFHYGFYVLVTLLLHWAAGMKWAWDVAS